MIATLIKWFFIVVYTFVFLAGVIAATGMIYGGYVELSKMMQEKKE